jgi:hypothetical protein
MVGVGSLLTATLLPIRTSPYYHEHVTDKIAQGSERVRLAALQRTSIETAKFNTRSGVLTDP